MFDSAIIETAIGLSLVFALAALLTTAVQELVASIFHSRARFLRQGMRNLVRLPSATFDGALYSHPLIASIVRTPTVKTSSGGEPGVGARLAEWIRATLRPWV